MHESVVQLSLGEVPRSVLSGTRSCNYWDEFIKANTRTALSPSRAQIWLPPLLGWLKLNVDSANDRDRNMIGIRCVLRNPVGEGIRLAIARDTPSWWWKQIL